jgi:hypothetical protein
VEAFVLPGEVIFSPYVREASAARIFMETLLEFEKISLWVGLNRCLDTHHATQVKKVFLGRSSLTELYRSPFVSELGRIHTKSSFVFLVHCEASF